MLGLVGKYVYVAFLCGGISYAPGTVHRYATGEIQGYVDCVLLKEPIKVIVMTESENGWCKINLGGNEVITRVKIAHAICSNLELILDQ